MTRRISVGIVGVGAFGQGFVQLFRDHPHVSRIALCDLDSARLAAVADQGGISLIWEPNAEIDLAGYLVLRGEAGDATLHPLTATPVVETRFRDTRVTPGSRYVYAVVAVDTHLPVSNVSVESNRVEETAR